MLETLISLQRGKIMKKIGIVGHFAFGKKMFDGQTIKTKTLTKALEEHLGEENILCVDTHGGIKTLVKIMFNLVSIMRKCNDVIMLPAHNGLLVITPMLSFYNLFFKRKLHYVVIGGWLSEYLDKHKVTGKLLKKSFCGIYVETSVMKEQLESKGFENIFIFPNYKDIEPISIDDIVFANEFPLKICTFSRIIPQKGIAEAIKAVCDVNSDANKILLSLDIYGTVDENYKEEFNVLINNVPEYIKYIGEVEYYKTVSVLKDYAFQLFPTKFKTEGIPGSVIEGFFAGVPVIAARWNSFYDLIDENVTGVGYEIENYEELENKIAVLINDFEKINAMKKNCIEKATLYKKDCIETIKEYFLDGVNLDVDINK